MIKENNQHPSTPRRNLTVQEFPLAHVKVDPQARVRQEFRDYKNEPIYIALRESMAKFGLRNPISLNSDCVLVEGFYRYNAALDLRWETISTIIDHLTEKEALELELQENFLRKDFTDYQVYKGIARLKREHEKDFPESKRGKYDRSSDTCQDHKTIIPSGGNMIINSPSFADTYCTILGMRKTTLYVKAQIGEAILRNKFNSKTIKALKEEKITQKQLLQKLRQIDNKKAANDDNLKENCKVNKLNLTHSNDKIKENEPSAFEKLERLINNNTSEGKTQWDKVKNKEISGDTGFQNIQKIEQLEKSIRKNTADNFRVTGENYKKKNKSNKKEKRDNLKKDNLKSLQNENTMKKMYICKRCPKATVMAIECKCEECGHLNLTPKVLCDDDMTNGSRRLRDPDSELCKNSPDYNLLVRN